VKKVFIACAGVAVLVWLVLLIRLLAPELWHGQQQPTSSRAVTAGAFDAPVGVRGGP
jgi:hypothetical protein